MIEALEDEVRCHATEKLIGGGPEGDEADRP